MKYAIIIWLFLVVPCQSQLDDTVYIGFDSVKSIITVYYTDTVGWYLDSTWIQKWIDPNISTPQPRWSGDSLYNPLYVSRTLMAEYPIWELHTRWTPRIDTTIVVTIYSKSEKRTKDWRMRIDRFKGDGR